MEEAEEERAVTQAGTALVDTSGRAASWRPLQPESQVFPERMRFRSLIRNGENPKSLKEKIRGLLFGSSRPSIARRAIPKFDIDTSRITPYSCAGKPRMVIRNEIQPGVAG